MGLCSSPSEYSPSSRFVLIKFLLSYNDIISRIYQMRWGMKALHSMCGERSQCKLDKCLVVKKICQSEWTTSAWEHPFCWSTTRACVHTHTHSITCMHMLACTNTKRMFAFSLSPPAAPALTDMLFHLVQYKLRHHGYNSRDVLSLGDRQYWNNDSPNSSTSHT